MAEFRCRITESSWGDYRIRLEQLRDARYGASWIHVESRNDFMFRWVAVIYAWFWVRVVRRRFERTGSINKSKEWIVK